MSARAADGRDPRADRERAFCVFATLWSLAVLFDHARTLSPRSSIAIVSLVLLARVSCAWVLVRPSNPRPFLLLNAALAATIVANLPKGANHRVLVLIATATVLAAGLRTFFANGRRMPGGSELYAALAPAMRWELIALYFWAVVHKLNVDFFDPAVSCGPAQVWNLRRLLPFLPPADWLQPFSIHGTLLVEAAIPCLLVARRTRVFGIALAAGFHLTIGAGYVGFSATLFALLSLFAPPRSIDALWSIGSSATRPLRAFAARGLREWDLRRWTERGLRIASIVLAVGATVAVLGFGDVRARFWGTPALRSDTLLALWFAFGALAIGLFAVAAWRSRLGPGEARALRPRYASLAIFPLLVFGVGLGPHLGIKNTQAFAMFSNLNTGGGTSNHFFLPVSWQHWDHLRDLVTIRESNDAALAKLVGPSWNWFNYFSTYTVDRAKLERNFPAPGWRLPYLALRRRITELALSGKRNVRLVYERNGIVHRLDRAETDAELSTLGWFPRKFLLLRAVPDTNRGYCLW